MSRRWQKAVIYTLTIIIAFCLLRLWLDRPPNLSAEEQEAYTFGFAMVTGVATGSFLAHRLFKLFKRLMRRIEEYYENL